MIAILYNMDDDDDNANWPEGEADEFVAVMEASPMLHEIDSVVKIESNCGLINGTTNVVDPYCHPSAPMVRMHSTSIDALS
jgi:hypothetical protein